MKQGDQKLNDVRVAHPSDLGTVIPYITDRKRLEKNRGGKGQVDWQRKTKKNGLVRSGSIANGGCGCSHTIGRCDLP